MSLWHHRIQALQEGVVDTRGGAQGKEAGRVRRRIIECAECGTAHYWCDACQRATCRHIVDAAGALVAANPVTAPSSVEILQAFVAWVLAEISLEAKLIELAETPGATYTLLVEIPGAVGKSLVVRRCLIDGAVASPHSLRTLRNILQTDIRRMTSSRALSDSRETLAEPFWHACSVCLQPIMPQDGLRFRQGDTIHTGCADERP